MCNRSRNGLLKVKGAEMGLRAYLLVKVKDNLEQEEFIESLREVERIPGVEFADPVIGEFDMVVMVDAPVTVEAVAAKVQDNHWFEDMKILKLINIFELSNVKESNHLNPLGLGNRKGRLKFNEG
jgi:DNA-binding Lrp family transcriptional regulator